MIWKINLSTSTEERKEKEAGSGGWRVKGEVSSHWGVRALLREGVSRSGRGGAQADLERLLLTEGGVSAGAIRRCLRGSGGGGRGAE